MKNQEMITITVNDLKFAKHTFTAGDMKDILADQGWVLVK